MRIIITGGTGTMGRALSERLVADGHDVIVLSRSPKKYSNATPKGVTLEKWDAQSAAGWGHLADGAGAIFNLAGAGIADKRWSKARKTVIEQSRLNAGQAVVEAIRAAEEKPNVVIQISGVGYYGQRRDEIIAEDGAPGDDFPAKVCQTYWEPSTAEVETMGVRRVIARTGVVLTTEGGAFPKMVKPIQLGVGGRLGSGDQWLSWIHMEDQVRALQFLMEDARLSGVFNLTAPMPVTNATFTRTVGMVINRPNFLPVPAFAMKLLFGEMSELLLTGQRVVPDRLMESGFQFRFPRLEHAARDLLTADAREPEPAI